MEQMDTPTDSPPRPPQVVIQVTELGRDSGCCRSLNWRCDLSPDIEPEALERLFVETGYRSRSRHPALKVFRHPEGHELAWVVATGRVQIRVAPIVEATKREAVARGLYGVLVDCLQDC